MAVAGTFLEEGARLKIDAQPVLVLNANTIVTAHYFGPIWTYKHPSLHRQLNFKDFLHHKLNQCFTCVVISSPVYHYFTDNSQAFV